MKKIKYVLMPLLFCCFILTVSSCGDDDAATEICNNGIDDDGDGDIDCADSDCSGTSACPEICGNSIDDDGDGLTDCADDDCGGTSACPEICGNSIDDDGDGAIDCADSNCAGTSACPEICGNGDDDDGDGAIDCADSDCDAASGCFEICDNGSDDDGNGLTDCADPGCASFTGCFEDCNNGIDDETASDGKMDCFDTECGGIGGEAIYVANWVGIYQIANGIIPFLESDNLGITIGGTGSDNIVTVTSDILRFTANATVTQCGKLDLADGIVIDFIPVGALLLDTIYGIHLGSLSEITLDANGAVARINFQGVVVDNGSFDIPLFPWPVSGIEIESNVDGSARN